MSRTEEKPRRIRRMFDRIAHRYDLLNHLLSGGSDILWRRSALRVLNASPADRLLDVGIGTGDLTLAALRGKRKPGSVVGVDVAEEMMRIGRKKTERHTACPVRFVGGCAESLPFRTAAFDGVMVAFGVRNFTDMAAGLRDMWRVLRPGGRLVVLELSHPRLPVIRQLYRFYSRYVVTGIGGAVSGDGEAYRYLQVSVAGFPAREGFRSLMDQAGFVDTGWRDLSLGIATVYWGGKRT